MTTITFPQAIAEVGEWSKRNFGDQKGAGALAPLAGIGEEIGEYYQAVDHIVNRSAPPEICPYENEIDALCDILVYLADLCYRVGVSIEVPWPGHISPHENPNALSIYYGSLVHAVLKRHQGIRGFDDDTVFQDEFKYQASFLFNLVCSLFPGGIRPAEEFLRVWTKVGKRDWIANPISAAEVLL